METAKLIIKYQGKYICDKVHNQISYITLPPYLSQSDFKNIDGFIALLCSRNLYDNFETKKELTLLEMSEIVEDYFLPDCLEEIEENVYLYDLEGVLSFTSEETKENYRNNLKDLPGALASYSYNELLEIAQKETIEKDNIWSIEEDKPSPNFCCAIDSVDKELLKEIENLETPRKENDCLLLYSGGKDSTLAAIRLRNAGYNVHFIHFDNGHMMDTDKAYLTFKKTFAFQDGYYFSYKNKSIIIEELFHDYFKKWQEKYGDNLDNEILDSEIRCLSCRMAMYTKAIIYAKEHHFKYIAEGARISQKFMIEQLPMIERLKNLASNFGIELLFPVLTLESNELEKQELIANGFSSKSWESKCLIGRAAMNKGEKEEKEILAYYDTLKEKMTLQIKSNLQK